MAIRNYHIAQQWSALMNIFTAENQPGKRLSTVKVIRKSAHLWTTQPPDPTVPFLAMGVQFVTTHPQDNSTSDKLVKHEWIVVAAVQSVDQTAGSQKTPANLDDAMARLQTVVDDGSGNGILAILRDPANLSLTQTAEKIEIGSHHFSWKVEPGAGGEVWAYAEITVYSYEHVSLP